MIWAASEADQAARGLSIRGETLWALEKGLVSRCHRLFLFRLKPTPINSSLTKYADALEILSDEGSVDGDGE
jgi:hypothetical protein